MENMKSLADKLREAAASPATNKDVPIDIPKNKEPIEANSEIKQFEKRKEEDKPQKKTQKRNTPQEGISHRISDLSFENDSYESVTIRFPKKLYSKLKLLMNEKLSIQKTTIYAVNELLESDEIKQKLKNILKSFNE